MASEVGELFGGGAGAPKPRVVRVYTLLVLGLLVAVAGMLCSAAPGGALVLLAWMLVEREGDRVESGYLPRDAEPVVARARRWTWRGLMAILGLFFVQGALLCSTSFYADLYDRIAMVIILAVNPDAVDVPQGQPVPGVAPVPMTQPGQPIPVPIPTPAP